MASTKASRKKRNSRLVTYTSIFFSLFFIALGVVFLMVASFKSLGISFTNDPSPSPIVINHEIQATRPIKISIPKINKVLEISPGEVTNNRWTVAENGVSFLTTSVLPGKAGNTVMYGHNKLRILGDLYKVVGGDEIEITMDNGKVYKYKIFETKKIAPTQVEILSNSNDARLTLYTCSGFLDQARFVVLAQLENP